MPSFIHGRWQEVGFYRKKTDADKLSCILYQTFFEQVEAGIDYSVRHHIKLLVRNVAGELRVKKIQGGKIIIVKEKLDSTEISRIIQSVNNILNEKKVKLVEPERRIETRTGLYSGKYYVLTFDFAPFDYSHCIKEYYLNAKMAKDVARYIRDINLEKIGSSFDIHEKKYYGKFTQYDGKRYYLRINRQARELRSSWNGPYIQELAEKVKEAIQMWPCKLLRPIKEEANEQYGDGAYSLAR